MTAKATKATTEIGKHYFESVGRCGTERKCVGVVFEVAASVSLSLSLYVADSFFGFLCLCLFKLFVVRQITF